MIVQKKNKEKKMQNAIKFVLLNLIYNLKY